MFAYQEIIAEEPTEKSNTLVIHNIDIISIPFIHMVYLTIPL